MNSDTKACYVLDARSQFPDATLAALYDPDLMKPALRRAPPRSCGARCGGGPALSQGALRL